MTRGIGRVATCAVATAAAVLWAYAVTVLQPLAEPGSSWYDAAEDRYTNWPRDLRWAALLAVAGALLVAGGGHRRRTVIGLLAAGAWLAMDLGLDRADPGPGALIPVAVVAGLTALVLSMTLYATRSGGDRGVLIAVAAVCAVVAPVAASVQSASGQEAFLPVSRWMAGALLTAVALAAASAANPDPAPRRTAVVAVAATIWYAGFAVGPASSLMVPTIGLPLLGVWLLSRRAGGVRSVVAVAAGCLLLTPLLLVLVFTATMQSGRAFTELAGDPWVAMPDADYSATLSATLTGLIIIGGVAVIRWVRAGLATTTPERVRRQQLDRLTVR